MGCVANPGDTSSVEYSNTNLNVENVNLDALQTYKDNRDLAYDGKRLKWNNNYNELQTFVKNIVGLKR